ncbi:hypothetical protein CEE62_17250 [Stenotrophomonas maltophilia]|nr:hypothetical protein CEE62_17250 [Stenotrophomonas maltophilia]
MDGATEFTRTYLQRPPQPAPPRLPTGTRLLTLLWPWLRPLRVQGAALQREPLAEQAFLREVSNIV